MRPLYLFLILGSVLCLSFNLEGQSDVLDRIVLHKYPSGRPKMVVYVTPGTDDIVKEEAFYPDGKLEFLGHYKNGLEHGVWKFYWPSGMLKTEEIYANGLEEGECHYYLENGKLQRMVVYKTGNPVRVVNY